MNDSVYQIITDRILTLLESDTVPWRKPWVGGGLPRSLGSEKVYRGINPFLLNVTSAVEGYGSAYWGTFNEIKSRGAMVRKGQHGTPIVFWKVLDDDPLTTNDAGEMTNRATFVLRYYRVFNLDQTDGDIRNRPAELVPSVPGAEDNAKADALIAEYLAKGPSLSHAGSRAFYRPGEDSITLPPKNQFTGTDEYYSTLYHELTHSTGHESRLNRKEMQASQHFGDAQYSREELIAEFGAAMLAGRAGTSAGTVENSAAYIRSWKEKLRGDAKLIVQAAAAGQKAADLIAPQ